MWSETKRKFLIKCEDCGTIISIEIEEDEDMKKIQNDEFEFECICEGKCKLLRD